MDGSSPFDPSATPRPGTLKPPADLPGALAEDVVAIKLAWVAVTDA